MSKQCHLPDGTPNLAAWLIMLACLFVVAVVGCGQKRADAEKPKSTQPAKAEAKQPQKVNGLDKDSAEGLVTEFTGTLRTKALESLRGPKDTEVIRQYIKDSLEFFEEKGFSPEQLALARAKAFDVVWDSLLVYAQTSLASEADEYRQTVPKFMSLGEEIVADANVRRAALRLALTNSKAGMVSWLAEHGADLNEKAGGDVTALMFAAIQKDKRMIEALLKSGADPNLKSLNGMTALMFAVQEEDNDIVSLFLSKGADPNIKDNRGRSALGIAKEKNQLDTVLLLKNAGAKE